MRRILVSVSLHLAAFAIADEGVELFKASTGPVPPSLLFGGEDGSAFTERSINPLFYEDASLRKRQSSCPYPVICSSTTCCPASTKCCGTGIKCWPSDSNCISTPRDGCCPYSAETCGGKFCADAGSVCCDAFVCPAGYQCNTNGGQSCCTADEIKCSGGCCPAGSTCSSTAGFCQRNSVSSVVVTSITRVTSTVSSAVETSVVATSTADPDACSVQKRATLPGCNYECQGGKWLPVVEIPNIAGRTDQLFISMCSGILNTRSRRGGTSDDFDILQYAGDGTSAKRKRRDAKCAGYCAEQKRVFNDASRLECDEYPPAMSSQGGPGAHRTCIPADQNSGEQGKRFSEFVNKCRPAKGSKFVVRMKGGCNLRKRDLDSLLPPSKRQDNPATNTTFMASGDQLRDLGNASSFIYVPFDDLRNGHYHLDASFEGGVSGISVIDSDGDSYYTMTGAPEDDSGQSIDFDVSEIEDGDPMPAALIIDTGKSMSVSYSATVTPAAPTATPSPTSPSNVSGAGAIRPDLPLNSPSLLVVVVVLVAGRMI